MKTRIISGAVLVVLLVGVLYFGGPVLLGALLFCSLVGMSEFYGATGSGRTKEGKRTPVVTAAYVCAALYYLILSFSEGSWCLGAAAVAVIVIMACYVASFSGTSSVQAVNACFGFVYVAVMLGFIYLIRTGEHGKIVVWLVFLSSWIADTCAYFTGYFLGKHKMSPVLSPKKTIEGALGGIAGSALSGVLFSLAVNGGRFLWQFALICGAGAVVSIFGDLAASAIKRDNNIKDYGNLIPGHGGIRDRFDSVIFTAPLIYALSLALIRSGF